MRIDVYHGDTLAAVFASGRGPVYYGPAGADVRRRVNTDHYTYNPYNGGGYLGGLQDEDDGWLVSSVASAVVHAGYTLDITDPPQPFSDGDKYTIF